MRMSKNGLVIFFLNLSVSFRNVKRDKSVIFPVSCPKLITSSKFFYINLKPQKERNHKNY